MRELAEGIRTVFGWAPADACGGRCAGLKLGVQGKPSGRPTLHTTTYPTPREARKRVSRRRRRSHGVETGLILTVTAVATLWCGSPVVAAASWPVGCPGRKF